MTRPSMKDVVALLLAHPYEESVGTKWYHYRCRCGWQSEAGDIIRDVEGHALHVAEQMYEQGWCNALVV